MSQAHIWVTNEIINIADGYIIAISRTAVKIACDQARDKTRCLIIILFVRDVETCFHDVHYVFSKRFTKYLI